MVLDYLTVADVLGMHTVLMKRFGGAMGVRDPGALEAALFRPQTGYYDDIVAEAAALLESLAINHPFVDGNKRVAFAAADVFLRIVPLIPGLRGMPATNDLSEAFLYLITLFAGPWLLRLGQHIRVDIFLRAIPPLWAWYCEWAVDVLGLLCSLVIAWYGLTTASQAAS